jgi:voltage-gated potassium channel
MNESSGVGDEQRAGARFRRRAEAAVKKRRVFSYLVGVTATAAVLSGLIAHLIDRKDFPTFGIGLWWAIVTLGTVGYGDVVPHTAWGRVFGSIVIIFGVTFIAFLIAVVTSMLVDADRSKVEDARDARDQETHALLQDIEARLTAIERRLDTPSDSS